MNGKYRQTIRLMNTIQVIGFLLSASSVLGWFWLWSNAGFINATVYALPGLVTGLMLMAVAHISGVLIDIAEAVRTNPNSQKETSE